MTTETRTTLRRIVAFYLGCAVVGLLLLQGEWLGPRISLELGTGGYIDNLKFGGAVLVVLFVVLEYGALRLRGMVGVYDWKDAGASYAIYIFNGLVAPLTLLWQFGMLRLVEPFGFTKISALGIEEQRVFVVLDLISPRDEWNRLGHGYQVDVETRAGRLQVQATAYFDGLHRQAQRQKRMGHGLQGGVGRARGLPHV